LTACDSRPHIQVFPSQKADGFFAPLLKQTNYPLSGPFPSGRWTRAHRSVHTEQHIRFVVLFHPEDKSSSEVPFLLDERLPFARIEPVCRPMERFHQLE